MGSLSSATYVALAICASMVGSQVGCADAETAQRLRPRRPDASPAGHSRSGGGEPLSSRATSTLTEPPSSLSSETNPTRSLSPLDEESTTHDAHPSDDKSPFELSDSKCRPLRTFTRHPANAASLDECVYDAAPLALHVPLSETGGLSRRAAYRGKLFRFVDIDLLIVSREEEGLTALFYERCSHLFDVGPNVPPFIELLSAPGKPVTCRPRWSKSGASCSSQHSQHCWEGLACTPIGCPRWFWKPATMIVRLTDEGYLLVVPPKR